MSSSISIVVPTLNSAKTLEHTLLSLHEQEDCEINALVADSGSIDGTLDICESWKVPAIYVPPGNMYRAINEGLNKVESEWAGYLNSDDIVYRGAYGRLMEFGTRMDADIVYGSCDYIDNEGRFLHSFTPAKPNELLPLFRCGVFGFSQQAAIFRKSVFEILNGFDDKSFIYSADADFYLRAILRGMRCVMLSGTTVACFRLAQNQLSHKYASQMAIELNKLAIKAGTKSFSDKISLWRWKLDNITQYMIRMLRRQKLSGHFTITKTMDY